MEKAGFGVRFVAYIIDVIILAVINAVVTFVLGLFMEATAAQMLTGLIGFVIGIAYLVYFWTTTGATPGKRVMNLRVVSTEGETISAGTAVIRYIGYFVSAVVFLLGFLWVIVDQDKQGWHDKIAGTYVIRDQV